jgi:lysophospholipase L1-like esterase
MNKPYWGLWTLLLVAFALFAALSFWSDGFNAVDIKTSSFGRTMEGLFADNDSTASGSDSLDASGRLPNGRHPEGWRAPMDTTAKSILFIGDSMLEGLGERLAAYCDKNGHKLVEVIWYSSSTLCWGETARLTKLINEYQPNYIMVCLGANELYVPDIKNARRPHLKKILKEIGDIPYLWIGPPNWVEDTGINDLLAQEVDEGCFYYSAKDKFTRSRDGAHPTRASAHLWMDRVVKWLNSQGAYPIRLDYPGEGVSRASRIVVYQPPV